MREVVVRTEGRGRFMVDVTLRTLFEVGRVSGAREPETSTGAVGIGELLIEIDDKFPRAAGRLIAGRRQASGG